MDSELLSILNDLKKEQYELLEITGCNYWGIKCSFINKTNLLFDRLIPYVDKNKHNDVFFTIIKESYIYYINSNVARLTYEIKKENNGVMYFEKQVNHLKEMYSKVIPFSRNYLSHVLKCLISNEGTLNSYNSFKSLHENELSDFNSEISSFNNLKNIEEVECYFRAKFMGNELSFLNQDNAALNEDEFKTFFFHYKVFDFIFHYNNYMSNKINSLSYASVNDEVYNLYKEHCIDLKSVDKQFDKYQVIEKNKSLELISSKDGSYLIDDRIPGYCLNITIDYDLLKVIEELINSNSIVKISFKVTSISTSQVAMEDFDRGGPLELDVKGIPDISSFYSENYQDKLIIKHDSVMKEITFEELRDDFYMINDSVVTQVVHLKYDIHDKEYFINHLDHELIVYSLEEYDDKIKDIKGKGSKGKIKSFKIDESKIPFFYKSNKGYFLYQVLDAYFNHKDLLREYFCKITQVS
ncbi:TPA: hypothetical protein ACG0J3_002194 [Escherichia coli]